MSKIFLGHVHKTSHHTRLLGKKDTRQVAGKKEHDPLTGGSKRTHHKPILMM